MSYKLKFVKKALKEWEKLDGETREFFKKKLKSILKNPHNKRNKLKGFENVYKIKLKQKSYRLAYYVDDTEKSVTVLIIAHRDDIYKKLGKRK
ncbi:toxin of toxin-antitoxin stability system [Thermotomaculum hydrothermale]|uniref:Toxin of toxin-antitoxin stability system n=1 Tax=Thermotomaculum hydrothermale TaxID=981385 RepID=A0A7R6T057_9BACT|nr:type II toxin-antitoxin system RelE/ParE family toxin [Thermotomaculum hydrothermale]BBB33435.1 toxin of toxin-antitoxin stability system [Thermotomaculum hydrothermale]